MPVLNLPAGLLPTNGSTADADDYTELWFAPASPDVSFAILNGGLDNVNLTQDLTFREILPDSQSQGHYVGRTANLDFFREIFNISTQTSLEGGAADDNNKYVVIPGGARRVYIPFDAAWVKIRWQINVANDAINEPATANPYTQSSQIKLFVDGAEKNATKRGCRLSQTTGAAAVTRYFFRSPTNDRNYHGHFIATSLSQGWHDFSLRVISNAYQTRIRVTNLSIVAYLGG